ARPVAAIVEMREAGYSSHEITVGASQESMIVIPPREYGGVFTRLRIFLRRRSGRPAMVSLNRFGRGQRRRRSAISRRRWRCGRDERCCLTVERLDTPLHFG